MTGSASLWVHGLAWPVRALGPGRRAVLWVSGCRRRCEGCIAPELWTREAGVAWPTELVAARLLALEPMLDGITLSGGEPFDQAAALAEMLNLLAAERPDWSVLAYSGHTLGRIRRSGPAAAALLSRVDILIAGPYRTDRPPVHPLAGSGNQCIHFLSPRGRTLSAELQVPDPDQVALGLGEYGDEDWLIGVPGVPMHARIRRTLAKEHTHPLSTTDDDVNANGES